MSSNHRMRDVSRRPIRTAGTRHRLTHAARALDVGRRTDYLPDAKTEKLKGRTEVRILRVDWLILAGDEW